ncbi:hypothetical protein TrCOL_g9524 [Triparma columacea]|uniref:Uncharacterized protein n=1 Tax=Triparma columacea TaxID=722753 RepID=A0A9W7GNN3_9STRA|nr:hypothetical protein TrCOL_g9524 [Triparma columacea]
MVERSSINSTLQDDVSMVGDDVEAAPPEYNIGERMESRGEVGERIKENVKERKELERRKSTMLKDRKVVKEKEEKEKEEKEEKEKEEEEEDVKSNSNEKVGSQGGSTPVSRTHTELVLKQNNALKQILRALVLGGTGGIKGNGGGGRGYLKAGRR